MYYGLFLIAIVVLSLAMSFLNPIIYITIGDFLKKDTEKAQDIAKITIFSVIVAFLVCILFLVKSLVIYDYIAIVAILIIISLGLAKKNIESFFYDLSKIYITIYSVIRLLLLIATLTG